VLTQQHRCPDGEISCVSITMPNRNKVYTKMKQSTIQGETAGEKQGKDSRRFWYGKKVRGRTPCNATVRITRRIADLWELLRLSERSLERPLWSVWYQVPQVPVVPVPVLYSADGVERSQKLRSVRHPSVQRLTPTWWRVRSRYIPSYSFSEQKEINLRFHNKTGFTSSMTQG
jgi:hypothetical protein